jgi:hypothetical protein
VIGVIAMRDGPDISFQLLDVFVPPQAVQAVPTTEAVHAVHVTEAVLAEHAVHAREAVQAVTEAVQPEDAGHGRSVGQGDNVSGAPGRESRDSNTAMALKRRPLNPVPLPPWKCPGRGIEDPHIWAVKKCDQLLADFLLRAPSGRFPSIWGDLQIMQVRGDA